MADDEDNNSQVDSSQTTEQTTAWYRALAASSAHQEGGIDDSMALYAATAATVMVNKLVEDFSLNNESLQLAIEHKIEALKHAGKHEELRHLNERLERHERTLNALSVAAIGLSGITLATGLTKHMMATSEGRLQSLVGNVATPALTSAGSSAAALATLGALNPIASPIGIGIAAAANAAKIFADYREINRNLIEIEREHLADLKKVMDEIKDLEAEEKDAAEGKLDAAKQQRLTSLKTAAKAINISLQHFRDHSNHERMELMGEGTSEMLVATAGIGSGLAFAYAATASVTPGWVLGMAGVLTGPVGIGVISALAADYLLGSAYKLNLGLNNFSEMMLRKWRHDGPGGKALAAIGLVVASTLQVVISPVTLLSHFYTRPVACLKQLLATMPTGDQWDKADGPGKGLLLVQGAGKGLLIVVAYGLAAALAVGKFALSFVKTAFNLLGAAVASGSILLSEGTWEQKKRAIGLVFGKAWRTLANNMVGAAIFALFTETPAGATQNNEGLFKRWQARFNALYGANNHDDAALLERKVEAKGLVDLVSASMTATEIMQHADTSVERLSTSEDFTVAKYRDAKHRWQNSLTEYIDTKGNQLAEAKKEPGESIKLTLANAIKGIMDMPETTPAESANKLKLLQDLEFNRSTDLDINTRKHLHRTWVGKSRLLKVFNRCKDSLLLDSGPAGVQQLLEVKLRSLIGDHQDARCSPVDRELSMLISSDKNVKGAMIPHLNVLLSGNYDEYLSKQKPEQAAEAQSIIDSWQAKDFRDKQKIKALLLTRRYVGHAGRATAEELKQHIEHVDKLLKQSELDISTHAVSETKQLLQYARVQLVQSLQQKLAQPHEEQQTAAAGATPPTATAATEQEQRTEAATVAPPSAAPSTAQQEQQRAAASEAPPPAAAAATQQEQEQEQQTEAASVSPPPFRGDLSAQPTVPTSAPPPIAPAAGGAAAASETPPPFRGDLSEHQQLATDAKSFVTEVRQAVDGLGLIERPLLTRGEKFCQSIERCSQPDLAHNIDARQELGDSLQKLQSLIGHLPAGSKVSKDLGKSVDGLLNRFYELESKQPHMQPPPLAIEFSSSAHKVETAEKELIAKARKYMQMSGTPAEIAKAKEEFTDAHKQYNQKNVGTGATAGGGEQKQHSDAVKAVLDEVAAHHHRMK